MFEVKVFGGGGVGFALLLKAVGSVGVGFTPKIFGGDVAFVLYPYTGGVVGVAFDVKTFVGSVVGFGLAL